MRNNEVTLRPANESDLSILYEFEQGIINAERPYDQTLSDGHINYYDLKDFISRSDVEVVVAEINDVIVGSGYVKIAMAKAFQSFEKYAYVGFMYVRPSSRGLGISKLIINELKTWAKSKGLNEMRLDVYDQNEIALKAYERVGFKKLLVEMRMDI